MIGGQVFLLEGGYNTGFRAPTTNPTFRNNIVVCNGNAVGWNGQYAGTLTIDSNNFYGCSEHPQSDQRNFRRSDVRQPGIGLASPDKQPGDESGFGRINHWL